MLTALLSLAVLAPVAFAAIHDVAVGGLQADGKTPMLAFTPNVVYAAVGDQVRFTLYVVPHILPPDMCSHPFPPN